MYIDKVDHRCRVDPELVADLDKVRVPFETDNNSSVWQPEPQRQQRPPQAQPRNNQAGWQGQNQGVQPPRQQAPPPPPRNQAPPPPPPPRYQPAPPPPRNPAPPPPPRNQVPAQQPRNQPPPPRQQRRAAQQGWAQGTDAEKPPFVIDPRYRHLICFNCGDPGHFVGNCPRPRVCFICAIPGHRMDGCSAWESAHPSAAYLGSANQGLGFYHLEVPSSEETQWLNMNNCGIVNIKSGYVTKEELENELANIYCKDWPWQIRELEAGRFLVRFPPHKKVSEIKNYPSFNLRKEGVQVEVLQWNGDLQPYNVLQDVWIQMTGIPPKFYHWKVFAQIASSFGLLLDVEWPSIFKSFYEMVRIKISCKDATKIPTERLFEMNKEIFVISFLVEGRDNGSDRSKKPDNDDDDGGNDDMGDDEADDLDEDPDGVEKPLTSDFQVGNGSGMKTPKNSGSGKEGYRTVTGDYEMEDCQQSKLMVQLMSNQAGELLTVDGSPNTIPVCIDAGQDRVKMNDIPMVSMIQSNHLEMDSKAASVVKYPIDRNTEDSGQFQVTVLESPTITTHSCIDASHEKPKDNIERNMLELQEISLGMNSVSRVNGQLSGNLSQDDITYMQAAEFTPEMFLNQESDCKIVGGKSKEDSSNHSRWERFRMIAKEASSHAECSQLLRKMELQDSDEEDEYSGEVEPIIEDEEMKIEEAEKASVEIEQENEDTKKPRKEKRKQQWGPIQRIERPRRFPEDGKTVLQRAQELKKYHNQDTGKNMARDKGPVAVDHQNAEKVEAVVCRSRLGEAGIGDSVDGTKELVSRRKSAGHNHCHQYRSCSLRRSLPM